jgi:hypothetical protein
MIVHKYGLIVLLPAKLSSAFAHLLALAYTKPLKPYLGMNSRSSVMPWCSLKDTVTWGMSTVAETPNGVPCGS